MSTNSVRKWSTPKYRRMLKAFAGTNRELAREIGVTPPSIGWWRKGVIPREKLWWKIARGFQCEVSDLTVKA